MAKKLTTQQFIECSNIKHGNLYDYSLVEYINNTIKVIIICKIHGEFYQRPGNHLAGAGCRKCGRVLCKETNKSRTGFDNPFKNVSRIKELRKYKLGVEHAMQSHVSKQKRLQTYINNFGVDNPSKLKDIKDKQKATCYTNFGVDNPSKAPEIKLKKIQTSRLNYKVDYYTQQHISTNTLHLMNNVEYLKQQHHDNKLTLSKISENLGVNLSNLSKKFNIFNINKLRFSTSQGERDLIKVFNTYNVDIIFNSRSIVPPFELDFYIPVYNIAIEFNGLYWHSDLLGKDRYYHLNKTLLCQEKGIRLIHIFESEWLLQQEIVKSRLLSILQQNDTIYARKCKIVQLTSKQSTIFFNQTHIQGTANASVIYGLEYNSELVAAMSFGKSRFNKQIEWELIRYSNQLNFSVVGGASRLFQYFIKQHNPNSVISYSDKRWNTGGLYLQLGFKYTHSSTPNYFYFKDGRAVLLSRQQFQKHKLKDKLEIFDPTLTEWQNMVNNGYNRIWDCGNDVFIWSKIKGSEDPFI